jgi:hypothetical protein
MKLKKSSSLKLQSQSQPNFAEMILGWSSSKIVSNRIYFKIAGKKKIDRRVEPPDTFLEENHPMTISSKYYLEIDVKFIAKMCSISRSTYPVILK